MKLKQYINFDVKKFFSNKEFLFQEVKDLYDYDNDGNKKNKVGVSVHTIIISDGENDKDSNIYEKLNFKILNTTVDEIESQFSFGDKFIPTTITKCVVYGQFQNQLSITISGYEKSKVRE